MKLLAIDTTTDLASVALLVNDTIYQREQKGILKHAQVLLPIIDELLQDCKISCRELDAIAFGRGPGSFTGLRIACSIAKGIAYAGALPVYPVSSLANIAHQAFKLANAKNILALIDARMGELYWGYFLKNQYDVEEKLSKPELIHINGEALIIAGVGYENFISELPKEVQKNIGDQHIIYPNATAMIQLVQNNYVNPVSVAEALPVYIRNQVTHKGN